MRKRYKVMLFINGILLIFSLLIGASYLYYLKNNGGNSSIVDVVDGLSINYLTGKTIDYKEGNESYTFSITNNSLNPLKYYIYLDNIINKEDNNYTYSLNESSGSRKETIDILPKEAGYLASKVAIESGKTHTYSLKITGGKYDDLKADIKIGIEDAKDEVFAATILNHSKINSNPLTKIYSDVAINDEGLISTMDDDGVSYYFRGNVQNNYVSFAGNTWRILKINGDNSVKLVLNDYIDDTANFYLNQNTIEDKLNYNESSVKQTLNSWYASNLKDYESSIIASKYCIDDSISNLEGNNTYYLAYSRINNDYSETNGCLGSKYTLKIGLITADEAAYAGASKNNDNTAYFLYTPGKEQSFWTLTPGYNDGANIIYYEVTKEGKLATNTIGSYYRGIKPVINLIKSTYVTGSGTASDPYTIIE